MQQIISACRERNATIDTMMSKGDMTLIDWIEGEKDKLLSNMTQETLEKKDDLIDLLGEYMENHISREAADNVTEVMQRGILFTANHLGGLYSAQSFQGDLCYMRLLKMLDRNIPCVPMLSFGLVPLNSSTFARGLITYTKTSEAEHFPIFPKSPTNAAASLTESYTAEMARRTRDKAINEVRSFLVRKQVRELMDKVYLRKDVLSKKRYPDQILFLGEGIYKQISPMTGVNSFYHMEAETVFAKLFLNEFQKKDGLLRQIMCDSKFIQILNDTEDTEGRAFSSLLFLGCANKRCFNINLFPDGYLRGKDVKGNTVEIHVDEESLKEAFTSMHILPHVYLSWLMSGFFRGFSWYGGILQSQYLQVWHKKTCEMFRLAGLKKESVKRENYDCSGYLSGPIYMLFDTGDGAVNAGPLECMAKKPAPEVLERLFTETKIKDAHEMGMFEFYNDLLLPNEKKERWYETISYYCKQHYEAHTLQSLSV
ncbi:hypothetical protein [Oribacterium sp. WCC10]|uniref:hypothetical protein n=1 Tax=Oribacterium sp. WCC10 TaxID=1855343 RepID=UPI0008F3C156|nr:hypothetical protein [Oribacterium sp. WCC10]SFG75007.1 hypothetical protein SAMN05216356_12411 [Oribacterium sp. WCC10]